MSGSLKGGHFNSECKRESKCILGSGVLPVELSDEFFVVSSLLVLSVILDDETNVYMYREDIQHAEYNVQHKFRYNFCSVVWPRYCSTEYVNRVHWETEKSFRCISSNQFDSSYLQNPCIVYITCSVVWIITISE